MMDPSKMLADANKLTEAPQYEYDKEKDAGIDTAEAFGDHPGVHRAEDVVKSNPLARSLRGRHMQMIAIGIRAAQQKRSLFLT
jgi:amino acid permease